MRGRKPKDVAMKILHGNPGGRAMMESSSGPFVCEPVVMPDGLSQLEQEEWCKLAETLKPILNRSSEGLLRVACSCYAEFMLADQVVRERGLTYQTDGEAGVVIRVHPAVKIRDSARLAYHRALIELGGSPVASTRVRKLPTKKTAAEEKTGTGRFFTR
ncbi:MAG: P27 family phage terminase small subunit [Nitrospira sp.]|nr:P27 family phage terminase small subunit [Nitrospira sp.]